jgi:hypothetical protein
MTVAVLGPLPLSPSHEGRGVLKSEFLLFVPSPLMGEG